MALQVALRRRGRQVNPVNILLVKDLDDAVSMAAVSALSTCSGSLCRTRPHTAGTGPNPAQLKAQMAALVLALAQAAKANAAAQAQRNQQACWQLCRVFNGSPHWRKPSKPRKQHQRQPHRRSNDELPKQIYRPLVKIQRQLTLRRGARRARVSRITHRSVRCDLTYQAGRFRRPSYHLSGNSDHCDMSTAPALRRTRVRSAST